MIRDSIDQRNRAERELRDALREIRREVIRHKDEIPEPVATRLRRIVSRSLGDGVPERPYLEVV